MTWEIFKEAFIDRFFHIDMRKEKVTIINPCQGVKSVHEYFLEFIMFSKYAHSLILEPRDKMSHFVTGCNRTYKRSANRTCYMTT